MMEIETIKVNPIAQRILDGMCTNHTGKMEGMVSLSTSCVRNEFCKKNREIPGAICQSCYATNMMAMYTDLEKKNAKNQELLTSRVLDDDEIPEINALRVRFESFGDLCNMTQLINYMKIVEKNPDTYFGLFTKNYVLIMEYFREHKCPDNMNIMISSMMINTPMNADKFYELGAFRDGQLKVFTVYNLDYLREHDDVPITCGSRMCVKCKQCYSKTSIVYVNEILKSDQAKVETLLAFKHPEKAQKGNLLGELLMGMDDDEDEDED